MRVFLGAGAQNFDVIRLSTYRTACKLRFVQKRCNRECMWSHVLTIVLIIFIMSKNFLKMFLNYKWGNYAM